MWKMIEAIIVTVGLFLVIGIVGGMEHNTISLSGGFWSAMGVCAAMWFVFFIGDRIDRKNFSKNNKKF